MNSVTLRLVACVIPLLTAGVVALIPPAATGPAPLDHVSHSSAGIR